MICQKCKSELHYEDKYCNFCGEKIDKDLYKEDYDKTIWGKFDKVSDWYDTLLLKKITSNWIFKILLLVAIILWGIFDAYTNYTSIKILQSESYSIEYNNTVDEYYIKTDMDEININLYVPGFADKIVVRELVNDKITYEKIMTVDEYKAEAITAKKDIFDYMVIDSLKGDKTTDTIKFYLVD